MALLSLWGAPPGALLAAGGAALFCLPVLRKGRLPGLLWVAGAFVGLVRLASGAGSPMPGFRAASLDGSGPLVAVAAGLLCVAFFYGVALFEGGRAPAGRALGGAAVALGVSVAGLFAESLAVFLGVLLAVQLLALALGFERSRGLRAGPVATAAGAQVTLGSGVLLAYGWNERRLAGGADVHDWIGTPFSGDTPSSLLFCGLALPIILPAVAGGFTFGFLRRPGGDSLAPGEEFRPTGAGLPSLGVGALLVGGLHVQFNGAEALGAWAIAAVGLALLTGAFVGWRLSAPDVDAPRARQLRTDILFAALAQGVLGLILVSSAAASESSEAAFGYAVLGALPALGGLLLASSRIVHRKSGRGALGAAGLGWSYPSTMIFSALLTLSLLAFPGTLGFLGRSQGLGALLVADGDEAGVIALAFGSLLALVALRLFHGLFLERGQAPGPDLPARSEEPMALRAALGLAAGMLIAFGLAPDALAVFVPFASAPAETFPSAALQGALLSVAGIAFAIWTRTRRVPFPEPSHPAPSYPPAHEAK